MSDIPEGIEALPNGDWVIVGDSHLSLWAKQRGDIVTDPWLFRFLDPYLKGVECVWDIGACIGDHTKHYLRLGKKVVAVEPGPLAFLCLSHNCSEAICLNLAASEKRSILHYTCLENAGASRITEDGEDEVTASAMDHIVCPPDIPAPDFCKIDVEGHEVFALRGMRETLEKYRPIVFIEINPGALAANGHTPDDIFAFFDTLGYQKPTLYPTKAKIGDDQYDCLFLP